MYVVVCVMRVVWNEILVNRVKVLQPLYSLRVAMHSRLLPPSFLLPPFCLPSFPPSSLKVDLFRKFFQPSLFLDDEEAEEKKGVGEGSLAFLNAQDDDDDDDDGSDESYHSEDYDDDDAGYARETMLAQAARQASAAKAMASGAIYGLGGGGGGSKKAQEVRAVQVVV